MPSEASTMKSCDFEIWKVFMSGYALTTLGLPFLYSSLASGSPNVRHTESRPGKTRIGPTMNSGSAGLPSLIC